MLKKLLKYDFRSGFTVMGIFYLVMALSFLLGLLFKQLKVQQLLGGICLLYTSIREKQQTNLQTADEGRTAE